MRAGLRIRGERGHPEVRDALIRYARWLRQNYDFPIRVPAYLLPHRALRPKSGGHAQAIFFAPFDRTQEPYIRIATGDYPEWKRKLGRDNALASWIVSLSHEVVHYRQWVETGETFERGVAAKANRMLDRYAKTVDHP